MLFTSRECPSWTWRVSRRRSWLPTLLVLTGVLLLPLWWMAARQSVSAAPPAQGATGCTAIVSSRVAPERVLLGETVDVTLTVRPMCPEVVPLHIVLVLDASGSMNGEPSQTLKQAVLSIIGRLELARYPTRKVGLVTFGTQARIVCELTNDEAELRECAGRVVATQGGSNISAGIDAGHLVIVKGRRGLDDLAPIDETIILFTDGADPQGCGTVLEAAERPKSQGVLLTTVCLGTACDIQCMRQAATSPRYVYEARSASQIANVFEQVRRQLQSRVFASLTITGTVPPNFVYEYGSAQPRADGYWADLGYLRWRISRPPTAGVTLTWRAMPVEVGWLGAGVSTYGFGLPGEPPSSEVDFDEPHVLVLWPPREVPTATPGSSTTATPTPSVTASPGATATGAAPSETPVATETAVPRFPVRLFFPAAIRDRRWR